MLILDILYYIFIVVACFQVGYYLVFFSQFAFQKETKPEPNNIPISVLICAKNEADNLKDFLPSIIAQNYPNFEIVLINDASYDYTLDVMEDFANKHPNIKIVNVRNNEAFWANKKYALTLGIKAAKNNHLLFTDADCKPISKNWISQMSAHFNNDKTIVLGYGGYTKIKKSFLNKLIRFETLLTAMQYLSFAKMGMPYMGVGRNLAYTKDDFFKASGFMKHMHIRSGDDDLFINQIATAKNTSVCVAKDSFTISNPKTTFKEWVTQKKRHITTAHHYKPVHKILLALFYASQLLFWLSGIVLLAFLFYWEVILIFFALRLISQLIIVWFTAKKLDEQDLMLFIPLLEFFLVIFQLTIFISNLVSKPKHWK
ncbi:glycosyltransferase [Bizionia argentinensis JUB59]|uniref:Glycosyltransferase n=1 Tax=Bizionia argentinensis JUB59 TaxID=1046627 RepID=G2EBQ1_9FLAO|nr:glycosyltransferase [Bizionia argentinensis]EGV44155.1 glycosyltransferase [Bizionia argentinensis JUB59]